MSSPSTAPAADKKPKLPPAAALAVAAKAEEAAGKTADGTERPLEQISATRLKPAEYLRTQYLMIAHATNVPADLLEPVYWAHVSGVIKAKDHVEVWADNGTWYAEVLVLDVGRGWARTHILRLEDLGAVTAGKTQTIQKGGYEIIHRGEHLKWSVVRLADKQVVSENHGTQGSAVDWLDEHLKAHKQ